MKKWLLRFTLLTTAAFANSALAETPTNTSLETSHYTVEVKKGGEIVSKFTFSSQDTTHAEVRKHHTQRTVLKPEDSSLPTEVNITSGIELQMSPIRIPAGLINFDFEYATMPDDSQDEDEIKQDIYSLSGSIVLAKGKSYCTNIGGQKRQIEFCIFRDATQ